VKCQHIGRQPPVSATNQAVRTMGNKIDGMAIIINNITVDKSIEAELRAAVEKPKE